MVPVRTSCCGPSGLSPQKPAPQPMRTISFMAGFLRGPVWCALLVERREAFAGVLGARHVREHELGVFERAVGGHLSDLRQRLLAEPDSGRRFAGHPLGKPIGL